MKLVHKSWFWLFVITILGALLRLYKLGEVPNGLYVDEAAIGYNAYSIFETARDEYGQLFPVFLRSFGAFSSPLYVYVSAPFIGFLGLSAYSIRLVSAVSGILTIPVVYLLVERFVKGRLSALLATLIFAISPWHIFFSRGAFEVNLSLFLLALAVLTFLRVRMGQKYFVFGVFLLAISTYAYHSLRLIPFIFVPFYALSLYKQKRLSFKTICVSGVLFLLIVLPQVPLVFTPAFSSRASGLFYFDIVSSQTAKLGSLGPLAGLFAFTREFLSQFFGYFSPKNIFYLGDSDIQRSIPDMGLFYTWILPLYFAGFWKFLENIKKNKNILLALMMISFALPAALARDPFSSLRALPLIIPLSIIIGYGINILINKFGNKKTIFGACLLSLASILFLWRSYFVLFAHERAVTWNYGFMQLAQLIENSSENFVIDTERTKPPHILLAFYLKIPPKDYQEFAKTKIKKGYYEDLEFDGYYKLRNFETRPIDWEEDVYRGQILVGDSLSISSEQAAEHFLDKVFDIRDPLGEVVFVGYRTNPAKKLEQVAKSRQQGL